MKALHSEDEITGCITAKKKKNHFFKDEEKGAKEMCQIWEEVREEGIAIGMERSAKALA